MDRSIDSNSRTTGIIDQVKNSIRAAVQDGSTSVKTITNDIWIWLMLLVMAIGGLIVFIIIGLILFIIAAIIRLVLFPIGELIETGTEFIVLILFALMPLAIGYLSIQIVYPTKNNEDPVVPELSTIKYPILLMGPILVAWVIQPEFLLNPGSWSGFLELGLGFLILTSIVYRSILYSLVRALKTTSVNNDSTFEDFVMIYPGIIGFIGFSWIAWAMQYRLTAVLSDDLAMALWELPQLIPGFTLTQSHIAEVPVVLAVSLFGLSAVSMLHYNWNRIQQTGITFLGLIYLACLKTILTVIKIVSGLKFVLQYITLTHGK